MKFSDFLNFTTRHKITPGTILLVCLAFWLTVFITRGIIFWAVAYGHVPAVFVRGYHIHHFVTGFLLSIIAWILLREKVLIKYIPLAILGCGLGLIFDEFIFWTTGSFNYWSLINLVAVITIGTTMVVMYIYTKRYDLRLAKINPNHLPAPAYYKAALVPVLFIVIFLSIIFSYRNIAITQAERASAPAELREYRR